MKVYTGSGAFMGASPVLSFRGDLRPSSGFCTRNCINRLDRGRAGGIRGPYAHFRPMSREKCCNSLLPVV